MEATSPASAAPAVAVLPPKDDDITQITEGSASDDEGGAEQSVEQGERPGAQAAEQRGMQCSEEVAPTQLDWTEPALRALPQQLAHLSHGSVGSGGEAQISSLGLDDGDSVWNATNDEGDDVSGGSGGNCAVPGGSPAPASESGCLPHVATSPKITRAPISPDRASRFRPLPAPRPAGDGASLVAGNDGSPGACEPAAAAATQRVSRGVSEGVATTQRISGSALERAAAVQRASGGALEKTAATERISGGESEAAADTQRASGGASEGVATAQRISGGQSVDGAAKQQGGAEAAAATQRASGGVLEGVAATQRVGGGNPEGVAAPQTVSGGARGTPVSSAGRVSSPAPHGWHTSSAQLETGSGAAEAEGGAEHMSRDAAHGSSGEGAILVGVLRAATRDPYAFPDTEAPPDSTGLSLPPLESRVNEPAPQAVRHHPPLKARSPQRAAITGASPAPVPRRCRAAADASAYPESAASPSGGVTLGAASCGAAAAGAAASPLDGSDVRMPYGSHMDAPSEQLPPGSTATGAPCCNSV